jgi:hypothetical protein
MPGGGLIWWHFGWPREPRSSLWRTFLPRRYGVGEDMFAPCYAVIDEIERATAASEDGAGDRP